MRSILHRLAALGLLAPIAAAAQFSDPPPPLVIVNARVWTGDAARPWAEAIAAADGRITAVGTSTGVRMVAPRGARVIDAQGALVTPGFIDAHVHFVEGGFRLASVQLRDADSPVEFARRIKAFAATVAPGTWILGGDWDHERWGGALPTRAWIDSITPEHPVFVNRLDGHMALANSRALEAASVTDDAADVAGGTIVRDADGRATGLLKDNAMDLVARAIPEPPAELVDRALDTAMAYVASQGVTSVHAMGSWADFAALRRARAAGRMRTRVYAAVPLATWGALRDTIVRAGRGDEWLSWGLLKGFVDGSLGSHTAAMLAPFTDAPNDTGLFVTPPDSLLAWVRGADAARLQVAVHAIGDRAIRTQLDVFAQVAEEHGVRDRRFRIEHAQHVAPEDLARFASVGVIASMQPYHAIDDGRWAEKVIGPERARGAYAFRSLLDRGARLAFGSDWFVAPPSVAEGLYAAVTRRTLDGANPDGWMPQERISLDEALRQYTRGSAIAGFQDSDVGVLRPNQAADLVLWDRDLFAVPPEALREARVRLTVVGGHAVYEATPP
jgi:predicted amidohydrolase YtcJ